MPVVPPFPLAVTPTPLQPMDRLGHALGMAPGQLLVKRDDLTGLAGGGNKARKLGFLVGDALAAGCDTLITGGAAQSNHVRMTAAAARAAGLHCTAVLGGEAPAVDEGNLVLDRLLGLDIVWVGAYDGFQIEQEIAETAMRLRAEGRNPYEIPLGGASPVGTLGYVEAADELCHQLPGGAIVYTATGTGGTQAGLVVGFGHHERVRGVDVGALDDVEARIGTLVPGVASLAGRSLPQGRVHLDREHVGPGYGARTDGAREALELCARLEGIILDPVYSAKAMAALITDQRAGRIPAGQTIVFLHTGGLPSLFTGRVAAWLAE
jgi:D-cysteine desulfhydrase family pyridoxal phosphate-dependent enzyme